MGVYIDMKMPKSCILCDLSHEDGWCPVKQDYIDRYSFETCPLVPVPPHGRLIDADALHKLFEAQWHYLQVLNWDENPTAEANQTGVNWCINTLHDEAPTIIQASGGSEI